MRIREAINTRDAKKLWDTVRDIINLKSNMSTLHVLNEYEKANELNHFYNHFECQDPSGEFNMASVMTSNITQRKLQVDPGVVATIFRRPDTKKASGPDGISAYLLKTFADELSPAWTPPLPTFS